MWTAVRKETGALLIPFHITFHTRSLGHGPADGAVELGPCDPGYDEFAKSAISEAGLHSDPELDALLIARWAARVDLDSYRSP